MKYTRYDAPPAVRLRYHFRDRFGKDIVGAREYDPLTGEGIREIGDSGIMVPFFSPGGYVEVDGHTNPSQEALTALFTATQATLDNKVMDTVVKKVETDVTLRKGKEINDPKV